MADIHDEDLDDTADEPDDDDGGDALGEYRVRKAIMAQAGVPVGTRAGAFLGAILRYVLIEVVDGASNLEPGDVTQQAIAKIMLIDNELSSTFGVTRLLTSGKDSDEEPEEESVEGPVMVQGPDWLTSSHDTSGDADYGPAIEHLLLTSERFTSGNRPQLSADGLRTAAGMTAWLVTEVTRRAATSATNAGKQTIGSEDTAYAVGQLLKGELGLHALDYAQEALAKGDAVARSARQ